jgi:hypothetical protein
LWARDGFELRRLYAGAGPAFSEVMKAWLVVVDDGKRLRLADDAAAQQLWPALEEAALSRVAELEALLDDDFDLTRFVEAQDAGNTFFAPLPARRR